VTCLDQGGAGLGLRLRGKSTSHMHEQSTNSKTSEANSTYMHADVICDQLWYLPGLSECCSVDEDGRRILIPVTWREGSLVQSTCTACGEEAEDQQHHRDQSAQPRRSCLVLRMTSVKRACLALHIDFLKRRFAEEVRRILKATFCQEAQLSRSVYSASDLRS
jgi:hypothetical protein